MSFDMDISGMQGLANGLGKIASKALPEVDAVLKKGAQNIKDGMISDVKGSPHFKGMARSITYDSHYLPGRPQYDIGPDKSLKGGGLGNIYYFGTSLGGGSGDVDKQLNAEAPRTVEHLGKLADKWAGDL